MKLNIMMANRKIRA